MSKIIFTTIGSLGDLYPQIAIAIELRNRGNEIVFAAMKEYRVMIEQLGFEFQPMRPDGTIMDTLEAIAQIKDANTGAEYCIRKLLMPNLRDTYTDLLAIAHDADAIIAGDIVYAAPLVAEKLGIPWISLALAPIALFSIADPSVPLWRFLAKLGELGLPINNRMVQLFKAVNKFWAEPIYQLRAELKLLPIYQNPLVDRSAAALVLAMFSAILAPPQLDWDRNTLLAGFTFYDGNELNSELPPALGQFLEIGEPPIVFTLGSAVVMIPGTFYQESIQAAIQLNRRAVLLIGNNPLPANLPANMIAINYVPHSQIFPHACAIVHQGGVGTTAQALRAGVPTLIMPYSYDQPDNAARVERLGTSRTIDCVKYTASTVANELRELLEQPQYAVTAAKISQIIQTEDGVSVACSAIIQTVQRLKSPLIIPSPPPQTN
jgi:rhamnosyltransferase subunit B